VGLPPEADPDQASGVALLVDGGSDVTIRGLEARGYRFGILARGTRDLRILDSELSYGWKPRLFSLVGHESLVDWLSYHNNESREWMRFGAAIYLEDVRGGAVRGNRAVQGMNGLLMTRTDSLRIEENDFGYNSGLGIGLYRSSWNEIVRNRLDYDVRGYSEGYYQRGQDSAGLLLYEQSDDNIVAYNSATHSGDGFFLWAGQSTMDTGEGGANDNLLFYNDVSYAPTNAVELTFSRNRIVGNYLRGSRYGVWGGYSWESEIVGNCIGGNSFGVAIEHGQDNVIRRNRFDGDSLAISLWARESEPADWGYARERDTRSRDHRVSDNVFAGVTELWRLERTTGHEIGFNRVQAAVPDEPCDPRVLLGDDFDALAPELPAVPQEIRTAPRAGLPRSAIIVDEWGPYDGRSPKLWPLDTLRSRVRLAVHGPPGAWRVVERAGVATLSAESGRTGDTLTATPAPGRDGDWSVRLAYAGGETISPRGFVRQAGAEVPFGFERYDPIDAWDVRFFAWTDPARDPEADPAAFDALFGGAPMLEQRDQRLDYQWFTPRIEGVPQERWAVEAVTSVELGEGVYSLRTISDDGIRVWIDGQLVIDHFEPHGSLVDYAPIEPGQHEIRVRYYQLGGWTELRAEIVRGAARSPGSPGPH
jgi:nitrous oxidase accessory protein NosD